MPSPIQKKKRKKNTTSRRESGPLYPRKRASYKIRRSFVFATDRSSAHSLRYARNLQVSPVKRPAEKIRGVMTRRPRGVLARACTGRLTPATHTRWSWNERRCTRTFRRTRESETANKKDDTTALAISMHICALLYDDISFLSSRNYAPDACAMRVLRTSPNIVGAFRHFKRFHAMRTLSFQTRRSLFIYSPIIYNVAVIVLIKIMKTILV